MRFCPKFKYLMVLFTNEGKMEREIDTRIGAAPAVKRMLNQAKLSICWSIRTHLRGYFSHLACKCLGITQEEIKNIGGNLLLLQADFG